MPNDLDKLTRNSYPGLLCGIAILVLTAVPGSVFPHVKPIVGIDKVAHVAMYAAFAFLCIWGYRRQYLTRDGNYRKKALLLTALISVAYGGITEIMQEYLVPKRTGDWLDFFADSAGTLLGLLVFLLFFKKRK